MIKLGPLQVHECIEFKVSTQSFMKLNKSDLTNGNGLSIKFLFYLYILRIEITKEKRKRKN